MNSHLHNHAPTILQTLPKTVEDLLGQVLQKTASLKNRTLRLMHYVFESPRDRDGAARGHKRIAYINRGAFSHINMRVREVLAQEFPDLEIEHIDIFGDILMRRKSAVIANVFCVLKLYGWDILRRRRSVRNCFYRTPYIFRKIKQLSAEYIGERADEFAFSFQTQSLFDASVEGVPHFVYTDHTHLANLSYPGFDRDSLFAREWIDLEREVYRNARKTFIMSDHVRRSVIDQYACDARRTACVYAGSNLDQTPLPLQNDNYRNKRILFVGVDWERKGGPQLLRAFEIVLKKIPDAQLAIVGCKPDVTLPNVEVIGRVPLDKVKEHLVEASVFCMPTRLEPFGIAPVEALFHKIPVVASRIGALPDVVEDGKSGRLVEVDNVTALADALIEMLSDPEKCRRFGEHGHRALKDRYSWQAVGKRMKREINAVLSK